MLLHPLDGACPAFLRVELLAFRQIHFPLDTAYLEPLVSMLNGKFHDCSKLQSGQPRVEKDNNGIFAGFKAQTL